MTRIVTDMLGREIVIPIPPKRIISLVPSQTELLSDLGLDAEVVGITKFCVHPESWFRTKPRVGGTKNVHYERVAALKPDLIIANKEENDRAQIEALENIAPVWVSDIKTLDDALEMIQSLSAICDKEIRGREIINEIRNNSASLRLGGKSLSVAYGIWRDPWMWAGGDTFINDLLQHMSWQNVLQSTPRYPEISLEMLASYAPDIILLSSEPYPFKDVHIAEVKSYLPQAKILLVDGEMFSWYGSRLIQAIPYLGGLSASYDSDFFRQ